MGMTQGVWWAVTLLIGLTMVCLAGPCAAAAPAPGDPAATMVLLWPEGAPGARGDDDSGRPRLTVHLAPAERATGAAIVVCPGGGYSNLAMDHEGRQIAQWLKREGVSAFILEYRTAPYRHPVPLHDAQRAIRTVRARAAEWGVDARRIGILGFSAGGHLASSAGTHFDAGDAEASDAIDRVSCRPDFMVLLYPVITLRPPYAHMGSRRNLLGPEPDPELIALLSNEEQVGHDTPPTFLVHSNEDAGVVPENSVQFYLALRKAKVPAEMHLYGAGPHGFGLAPDDPVLSTWPGHCIDWMRSRGFMERRD